MAAIITPPTDEPPSIPFPRCRPSRSRASTGGHPGLGHSAARYRLPALPTVANNGAMEAEPPKAESPQKRRWYQFRLRTLMIGVTLLAVVCGYVGWRTRSIRERRSLVDRLAAAGCAVSIAGFEKPEYAPRGWQPTTTWFSRLLGDLEVCEISSFPGRDFTKAEREEIRRVFPELRFTHHSSFNENFQFPEGPQEHFTNYPKP